MAESKKRKKYSEEEEVTANYIINFYKSVNALTHFWANYENVVLELNNKYSEGSEGYPANEKQVLLNNLQDLRYYVHKTFIEYSTMCKALGKDFPEKLNILYKSVKNQMIIKLDDIMNYVMQMNFALEEKVMQNLLKSSSQTVEQIYGSNKGDSELPAE